MVKGMSQIDYKFKVLITKVSEFMNRNPNSKLICKSSLD